ncbi:MAG: transcriptional repressor LexA [Desulfobacterales bacterium]|nr:MAG: transcriptional repressor LexA [Desulfobacterales bacterium]
MSYELTPKQKKALEYFEQEITHKGTIPSLRQAAEDLGISHTSVAQFIRALESKGFLRRRGKYGRQIELLPKDRVPIPADHWRKVPIIGKINAGLPLYAQQQWDGAVMVDGSVYRAPNLFALRVSGDSMKNAGILDSDIVICEPRQYARDGEIIVALINNEEATVKRFFLKKTHIELRPENEAYKTTRYRFGELLIQGKVMGLQRGPEHFE